jgi:hypothetical protein
MDTEDQNWNNCPSGNFAYLDDNPTLNWSTLDGPSLISNLNMNTLNNSAELNENIEKIMKIKSEFTNYLSDKFTELTDLEDKDFVEHKKKIEKGVESINELMESFDNQQRKVIEVEERYKKSIDSVESDSRIITEFNSFVTKISKKYKEIDVDEINKPIVKLCEEIRDNTGNLELKNEYQKELYILKYYLHHFIKKINQGNIGSTCSLCIQQPVDTFLNPCGHTGCSDCIEKLKDRGNEHNLNCFICRQRVNSFHKLYFI